MFTLNFLKKLMSCPIFPDDILHPYVPTTTKHAEPDEQSPITNSVEQSEEETNFEPPPHPAAKATLPIFPKREKINCRNTWSLILKLRPLNHHHLIRKLR